MGCDIHLYVETKRLDGNWQMEALAYDNPAWPEDEKYYDGYRGWSDRNYDTFAILANVRNGSGFAGVDTGDGFSPIDDPRGLPDDIGEIPPDVNFGDHSFSWLLYSEILGHCWNSVTTKRGWVGSAEFLEWQKSGRPCSYRGGVSGSSVRHITNQEMAAAIEESATGIIDLYTQVSWEVTYREAAARFLAWLDRVVAPLAATYGPDNVRLVFGFDS